MLEALLEEVEEYCVRLSLYLSLFAKVSKTNNQASSKTRPLLWVCVCVCVCFRVTQDLGENWNAEKQAVGLQSLVSNSKRSHLLTGLVFTVMLYAPRGILHVRLRPRKVDQYSLYFNILFPTWDFRSLLFRG